MAFDIEGARRAGYSEDEIAEFLAKDKGFNYKGAIDSGYTSSEVLSHLTGPASAPKAEAAPPAEPEPARTPRKGGTSGEIRKTMLGDSQRLDDPADPRRVDLAPEKLPPLLERPDPNPVQPATPPMIRPEFVSKLREQMGQLPVEQRMAALQGIAQGQTTTGRAARQLLDQLEQERAGEQGMVNKVMGATGSPGMRQALMDAPAGPVPSGNGKRPPAAIPDISPNFGEVADQVPAKERARGRLADSQVAAVAQDMNMTRDPKADFSEREFAEANPTLGALKSGTARQMAGLLNVVPLVMDFASRLVGNEGGNVPNAPGVDYLMGKADNAMPKIAQQEPGQAWDKGEFGGWLMTNLVAQAPQITQMVVGALVPGAQGLALASMGATSAGQSFAQGDKSSSAVLKGIAEVAGEKASFGAFERTRAALMKLPAFVGQTVVQTVGKQLAATGVATSASMVAGAIEETVTQLAQNGVDKVLEGKDKSIFEGVDSAAILGAFTNAAFTGVQAATSIKTGERQFAEAFAADTADRTINPRSVDDIARQALNPNSNGIIRSALEQDAPPLPVPQAPTPRAATSFTEPDSETAKAGLTPIVLEMPSAPIGDINVGEPGAPVGVSAGRPGQPDADARGGLGLAGYSAGSPTGDVGTAAARDVAGSPADVPARTGPAEQATRLANPAQRSTDTDLLARAEAATPVDSTPTPTSIWTGRGGAGYATRADAEKALPSRQRQASELSWKIEEQPDGKFRLAGYEQEGAAVSTASPGEGFQSPVSANTNQAETAAPPATTPATPAGVPAAPGTVMRDSTQDAKQATKLATQAVLGAEKSASQAGRQLAAAQALGEPDTITLATERLQAANTQLAAARTRVAELSTAAQGDLNGTAQRPASSPGLDSAQGQAPAGAAGTTAGRPNDQLQLAGVGNEPVVADGAPAVSRPGRTRVDPAVVQRDLISIQDSRLRKGEAIKLATVEPAANGEADTPDVRLAQAVAESFNAPIVFVRATTGKATFNGATIGGVTYVNADGDEPVLSTAVHETFHNLPKDIRDVAIKTIMEDVTPAQRAQFLKDYDYGDSTPEKQDEELVAKVSEQQMRKPEFWTRLAEKVGDNAFGKIAKEVLSNLDKILSKFSKPEDAAYTSNAKKAREALTTAYAAALQRQGITGTAARVAMGQASTIDVAAQAAATSQENDLPQPTDGQKMAGNYKVGRARLNGMSLSIENPEGSVRSGVDANGKPWQTTMKDHYGYVRGTLGRDGDQVDAFIKPGTPDDFNGPVFVVDQIDPITGEFDEHKVVVGAETEEEARDIYTRNYNKGWDGLGAITEMPMDGFKGWLSSGDTTEPADPQFSEKPRKLRNTEAIGEFQGRTEKDGSLIVQGDTEAIRSLLPDNVKGRISDGNVVFTSSDAPRARAALEGRKLAYSRAGAVVEKLVMKNGKYLGAPPGFDRPQTIGQLRTILRQLADEGEPGRFWYENSSKAVLRMAGGDVQEARKLVALLAIYSPQAKVDTNSTFGLRAWSQYKAGVPVSVKTGVMDTKATRAMDNIDEFWSGEKTGNFFNNLLRIIDPSSAAGQGATIDMWMMRAAQYPTDAPTKTQYSFMENENNRLAAELGWEPQQVQAAIWVAMKARMENSGVKKRTEAISEKKGWLRYDYPIKKGKPTKTRVILNAQKHRDNWLAQAMKHDVTKGDTQAAKLDFEDGLQRHIGQISFEARPGRSTNVLPGIHDAPADQQLEFQQAVQRALYNEQGGDELAIMLGLLIDNNIEGPGVWQGEISPSNQLQIPMAPTKGDEAKGVDPAQKKLVDIYAAIAGLVARQEGVGWHRPFYTSTKKAANGVELRIGRALTRDEAKTLWTAFNEKMLAEGIENWEPDVGMIASPLGMRLVNYGAMKDNNAFRALAIKAGEALDVDSFDPVEFASSGGIALNDWKENPNGQGYASQVSGQGRSDVLDWARAVLAPRVQRVFDEFSDRYGWGNPGSIDFSEQRRGDRGGRDSSGAIAPLEGAPTVVGASGPDPRVVQVAEAYAKANGITLRRQAEFVKVDPVRGARIADAYAAMPHRPADPKVRGAYLNLIKQTTAQYQALADAGFKFYFFNETNDPYAGNPWNAMRDLRANQTMGVFATEAGYGNDSSALDAGDNPLLADTGITWTMGPNGKPQRVLANDLFRAVHDAFGHGMEGAGFRGQGEENAWQAHVRLFTGSAVAAITSETRGQNSWLNYGPNGQANQNAKVQDTVFAEQKTGLMPEWTWTEGRAGDAQFSEQRNQTETPEFKAWFAGSKVEGVVYHGTSGTFDSFDPAKSGRNYGGRGGQRGFFFTNRPIPAGVYAEQAAGADFSDESSPDFGNGSAAVMPVYLAIKNPYTRKAQGSPDKWFDSNHNALFAAADKAGADGIIVRGGTGFEQRMIYVAFKPEQIKSATGNRGTFDGTNPDIRFSEQREVSPLGLYSELLTKIAGGPGQAKADQWKAYIAGLSTKGVKSEEIEWSGVKEWLDMQPGKVTKAQVQDFLRGNGVQVEEVVLGEPLEAASLTGRQALAKAYDDAVDRAMEADVSTNPDYIEGLAEADRAPEEQALLDAWNLVNENPEESAIYKANEPTKYNGYTLPGGTNYREVLLTLPLTKNNAAGMAEAERLNKEAEELDKQSMDAWTKTGNVAEFTRLNEQARELRRQANKAEKAGGSESFKYQSTHWDQKNIVAHIRMNDRTDADGKKVLFIEEVQSDWGQEGKKKGFAAKAEIKVTRSRDEDADEDTFDVIVGGSTVGYVHAENEADALARAKTKFGNSKLSDGLPAAPFVTKTDSWLQLALKRVIGIAAKGGYDRVAFVTGDQSAERYDLSKQISKVRFDGGPSGGIGRGDPDSSRGMLYAYGMSGNLVMDKFVDGAEAIADNVGKEVASRLLSAPGEHARSSGGSGVFRRELSGLDLKVGGEGMKTFYNVIVPNAIKAVTKKFGGSLGMVDMTPQRFALSLVGQDPVIYDKETSLYYRGPKASAPWGERSSAKRYLSMETAKKAMAELGQEMGEAVTQPGFDITMPMRQAAEDGLPMFSNQRRSAPVVGDETRGKAMRRIFQDYFIRVRDVQDAIIGAGGSVTESTNVYKAEERMYGRVQAQLEDFAKQAIEPMLKRAQAADVELDELSLYAYAMHAPERNAAIDAINPGLNGEGSGMSDVDAAAIVQSVQASPKAQAMEDLRQDLLGIAEATRQVLLQEGLITQDEYDAWTGSYQDYVPLRGFEGVDEQGRPRPTVGRGYNIRGAESVRALGRKSKAGDIIENIVRDYERAVIRAERNTVGKVLLDLVLSNPDPTLWEANAKVVKRTKNRLTGLVELSSQTDSGEDTVSVKVAGKEVYVKIHDELLLRALRQTYKDESGQAQGMVMRSLAGYNTWMRNTLTRYNPVFGMVNAARDFQTGAFNTIDELGFAGAAKYTKYYRAAFAASARNERGALGATGSLYGDPVMDRYFEEFKAAGGTTGGWFLRDLKTVQTDMRDLLLEYGAQPNGKIERVKASTGYQAGKAVLKYVELFGAASENASRLAAFRAAREMGKTPAEAASIAKNLTTNFNRKGEWGQGLNSLYLFFNAGVQGTHRTLRALKNPKVLAVMAGMTAVSAGLAALGGAAGDDDDDQPYWDKIPDYEKERNLIIMLPPGTETDGAEKVGKMGRYLKVPTPYGFNVFTVLGYQIADLARYGLNRAHGSSPAKAAVRMVSAVAGSYNPLGGSFDVTNPMQATMAVAPTLADLGLQLAFGVDGFGKPVGPQKSDRNVIPDAENFTVTQAGTPSQKIARWLNNNTGGNQAYSGAIDISAGTINNLGRAIGGGTGSFIADVFVNMPSKLLDVEGDVRSRDLPFLRNVFGEVDARVDRGLVYERVAEATKKANEAARAMKLGIQPRLDEDTLAGMALADAAKDFNQAMTEMRKAELQILDDPDMTRAEKKAARMDIERARAELTRGVNQAYMGIRKAVNDGDFKE